MLSFNKPVQILAVYKIIQGLIETTVAFALLFFSYDQLQQLIVRLSQEELAEDPNNLFWRIIFNYLPFLSQGHYQKWTGAGVLVVGLYDVITGLGLLFEKNWARDILLFFLLLALPYNLYQLIFNFRFYKLLSLFIALTFIYFLWQARTNKQNV